MQLNAAAEFCLSKAMELGAEQADIIAGSSHSSSLMVFDAKVQSSEMSISQGVGIRLFKEQKPGYSFSERLTASALEQAVRDALDQTYLTQELHLELPEVGEALIADWPSYDSKADHLDLAEFRDACLSLESRALAAHHQVENVPHLGAECTRSRSILMNSKGFSHQDHSTHFGVGMGVVSALDGVKKMGVASSSAHFLDQIKWSETADLAVERSLELLQAKPIPSGHYPLLLSSRVSGQMLSLFSSIFSADQVQKGLSRLANRLGETIASSCLTLHSDPLRPDLPASRLFDSEGVPARKVELIKDGVLTDFLYNLETAQKAGRTSNACAQRSYSGRVGVGFSNLIVPCSNRSRAEIAGDMGRFLEVVKLEGATGCSAVSGQISIGIQGFLWENGQRVQAVDRVTISGDFFEWMTRIVAVGNEYEPHWTSLKVPDLWIESAIIAS